MTVLSVGPLHDLREVAADMLGLRESRVADDGTYTYVGTAKTGTATSAALWRICRYDSNGSQTRADGNGKSDNVWNNYAILSYS